MMRKLLDEDTAGCSGTASPSDPIGSNTAQRTPSIGVDSRKLDSRQSRGPKRRLRPAIRQHIHDDRIVRVRLLAWSLVGMLLLGASVGLRPATTELFGWPSSPAGWASLIAGSIGVWLVPGLWLSALVAKAGAGTAAWLATRFGTTLAWYALVGPVIHHIGQGARVTGTGILIMTISATASVAAGVALGMSRWPNRRWQRAVLAAAAGALCAQLVTSVVMRVWTVGMNYEHIRRLDWLIVTACAAVVVLGCLNRPQLLRSSRASRRTMLISFSMLAVTASAAVVAAVTWPPLQRMPSALGIEQGPPVDGADLTFFVTAIGDQGPLLIRQADFVAFDEHGQAITAEFDVKYDGLGMQATLVVTIPGAVRRQLCGTGPDAKVTVREQSSGVRVQGVLGDRSCRG